MQLGALMSSVPYSVMPYALIGQSAADALSQSQTLAQQFGFGFSSGALVVGRSAAWAKLTKPTAANKAIPSLFIAAPEKPVLITPVTANALLSSPRCRPSPLLGSSSDD